MRILLLGRTGQVGGELERALRPMGELTALARAQADLADPESLRQAVRGARPELIVNAAAYTAVDAAEREEALATQINGTAPGVLGEEAKRAGALLVHYSTDYVFDGEKNGPYKESDAPNPVSAYGRSKLAGERAVAGSGCRHLVVRTSWVYAARGKNFLLTILRLAREGKPLRVVNDQHGAPTTARAIARATAELLRKQAAPGTYHMSAAGQTSWHGFAAEIVRQAGLAVPVQPISSADYGAPARRPRNSALDNGKLAALGIRLPDWRDGLRECLAEAPAP